MSAEQLPLPALLFPALLPARCRQQRAQRAITIPVFSDPCIPISCDAELASSGLREEKPSASTTSARAGTACGSTLLRVPEDARSRAAQVGPLSTQRERTSEWRTSVSSWWCCRWLAAAADRDAEALRPPRGGGCQVRRSIRCRRLARSGCRRGHAAAFTGDRARRQAPASTVNGQGAPGPRQPRGRAALSGAFTRDSAPLHGRPGGGAGGDARPGARAAHQATDSFFCPATSK